jgi:uncharacterized protein (TIGR03083 family)
MEIPEYIEALRREGRLLLDAAADAGLETPAPSCAGWDVRELVRHIGGVHHWAAEQVRDRHQDEISGDLVDIVGGWPPDDELLEWAGQRHAHLVDVFEAADPAFAYFTWMPGPTPLTMWTRRQAHETAVHRIDAELAAGRSMPFDATFAADGIDELVIAMIGNWPKQLPVDRPRRLHVCPTDDERAWTIVLTPGGFETSSSLEGEPDCTVRGPADALYRVMWHRGGDDDTDVDGDRDVVRTWHEQVHPAWS